MNYTTIFAALMIAVIIGILLLRRPAPAAASAMSWLRRQPGQQQDARGRHKSRLHEGSATLWIGALEAAMGLAMVFITLALTDAATATRTASSGGQQVVVDAAPETADQQQAPSSATGGASPVRPTHRLVALESSAVGDGGVIIIELDSPLPIDRPVKFLINAKTSPK